MSGQIRRIYFRPVPSENGYSGSVPLPTQASFAPAVDYIAEDPVIYTSGCPSQRIDSTRKLSIREAERKLEPFFVSTEPPEKIDQVIPGR
jgi:hypothetical protein